MEEVNSIIKGGMGFVDLMNLEKRHLQFQPPTKSKTTGANLMISSLCQLLPVVSRSRTT
jgi:hypothetical protein